MLRPPIRLAGGGFSFPMNAAFTAARAREDRLRLEAHLPFAGDILGVRQVPLTWRHLIELSRAGNAFFHAAEPTADDVFDYLWRLHPAFRRPDGELANLNHAALTRGAPRPSRFVSWCARLFVSSIARRISPNLLEKCIRSRIADAFMDRPSGSKDEAAHVSPLLALPTWYDLAVSELGLGAIEYPVALTFQALRVRGIQHGHADQYIPPSASLAGPPPVPIEASSSPNGESAPSAPSVQPTPA